MMKIRKAAEEDAEEILGIIEEYKFRKSGEGSLLPINAGELHAAIERGSFLVASSDEGIMGCVSLAEYDGIAEMRSLAVKSGYAGNGIGSQLIDACKKEAYERHYEELYSLVQTERPFDRNGFTRTETPPQKMKNYCAKCPLKDNGCKEFAMVYRFIE